MQRAGVTSSQFDLHSLLHPSISDMFSVSRQNFEMNCFQAGMSSSNLSKKLPTAA
jgi:hypothetical protein